MRAGCGSAAVAAILAQLLAACGDEPEPCDVVCAAVACTEPIFLAVSDVSTLAPVPHASASSAGLSCSGATGFVQCNVGGVPGTYDVVVSAPGYGPQRVSVTVEPPPAPAGACECPRCQEWQPRSVALAETG